MSVLKINENSISIVLIVTILTSSFPFLFFNFSWHPYKLLIAAAALVLFIIVSIKGSIKKFHLPEILFISSIFSTWVITAFHLEPRSITLVFHLFISVLVITVLTREIIFYQFARAWFIILFIFSMLGLASFITVVMGWVNPEPLFQRPGQSNQTIFLVGASFTNSLHWIGGIQVPRVAGPFDEPGQLAVVIIYCYIFSHFLQYSNTLRYLLILAGFATSSLAFMISLPFLLFLTFVFNKKNTVKPLKSALLIVILVFGSTIWLGSSDVGTHYFQSLVIERITDTENLRTGENRKRSFDAGMQAFYDSPLLGVGRARFENDYGDPSSIMGTLGSYGLLGAITLIFPFLIIAYLAIINKNLVVLIAIFIVLINFIHRPPGIGIFAVVMNYTLIVMCFKFLLTKGNKNGCCRNDVKLSNSQLYQRS